MLCVVIISALTDWLPATTTTASSFVSLYLCIVSAAAAASSAAPLFCFSFCTFCFVLFFVCAVVLLYHSPNFC